MVTKKQQNFATIRGDVIDGAVIYMDNGQTWTLRNTMRGWVTFNEDGDQTGGPFNSAMDVEAHIVNQQDRI